MKAHERILKEGVRLFVSLGVASVSTDEISKRLGISKRTFYKYFRTKEALLKAVLGVVFDDIMTQSRALEKTFPDAVGASLRLWDLAMNWHQFINPSFLRDIERGYPDVWDCYLLFRNEFRNEILGRLLREGISQGVFQADLAAQEVSRFWQHLSESEMVREEGETIKHLFVRGLLTAEGWSLYRKACRPA